MDSGDIDRKPSLLKRIFDIARCNDEDGEFLYLCSLEAEGIKWSTLVRYDVVDGKQAFIIEAAPETYDPHDPNETMVSEQDEGWFVLDSFRLGDVLKKLDRLSRLEAIKTLRAELDEAEKDPTP